MDQFETPEWGEGHKEEEWSSGLFKQSNPKIKKKNNRARNKYPKGFAKSASSETEKSNSAGTSKSPKPKNPKERHNDQEVQQGSKKKRKKVKPQGSSTPQIGQERKLGNGIAQNVGSQTVVNGNHTAVGSALKTNESSKSEGSNHSSNRNASRRRKRKKNKELGEICNGAGEKPVKVKKLAENSTVNDEITALAANETKTTDKLNKKKRIRKKKKSKGSENTEEGKPSKVNAVDESTPKLSSSARRRARKKRLKERKEQEKESLKQNKKKSKSKARNENESEGTQNTEMQSMEGVEENVDTNYENLDVLRKGKKKHVESASNEEEVIEPSKTVKVKKSKGKPVTDESPDDGDSIKKDVGKKRKLVADEITDDGHSENKDVLKKGNKVGLHASPPKKHKKSAGGKKEDSSKECSDTDEEKLEVTENFKVSKNGTPSLRERMEEKLKGAKFRFLNEQLYTSKSGDTNKYFMKDPKEFEAYHEGYQQQMNLWPVKPIDLIIKSLKKKPSNLVIADFGCGDATLAKSLPNKVHSFDHVALNKHVTVCDMMNTPLSKESVDVVVFCLSLMGSNLSDYIAEANRVLKMGGLMKIAEVESRFDDVGKFIHLIGKFGFLCTKQDTSNDYFYLFDFRKEKNIKKSKTLPSLELGACSYKKR